MYLLISQATNTPSQIFTPVLFVPLYTSHFAVHDTLAPFTPIRAKSHYLKDFSKTALPPLLVFKKTNAII